MSAWRLSIAVLLGLAWCCSDCVRALSQWLLWLLLCFSPPLSPAGGGRDGSTQTEAEARDPPQVDAPLAPERSVPVRVASVRG